MIQLEFSYVKCIFTHLSTLSPPAYKKINDVRYLIPVLQNNSLINFGEPYFYLY